MWNYRIIKHVESDGEVHFSLHEVYYNGKNEPYLYTADPILTSDTVEGIQNQIGMLSLAITKPVLTSKTFSSNLEGMEADDDSPRVDEV